MILVRTWLYADEFDQIDDPVRPALGIITGLELSIYMWIAILYCIS